MKYALIGQDGALQISEGTWAAAAAQLGPEGWSSVRLDQATPALGWRGAVNDIGLLQPEKYPRNVIGSLMLIALGGNVQPYAGPVLITGFVTPPYASPDVTGLDDTQAELLGVLHSDVRRALDQAATPERPDIWKGDHWSAWAAEQRRLAEHVRTCPMPRITVITDLPGGEEP